MKGFRISKGQVRSVRGQATLSFVLLVGGIIVEVAIAGALIAFFLSGAGLGDRLSARAYNAAQTGIRDAELKIARNKEFCGTCSFPIQYSFPVGSDSVVVNVTRVDDSVNNAYLYTFTSTGTSASRQRKFVAVLAADKATGSVQLKSNQEQSVQ
ncbi:MAG: hypothetical protein AAB631_02745 [Patescibacteria group bacterium]